MNNKKNKAIHIPNWVIGVIVLITLVIIITGIAAPIIIINEVSNRIAVVSGAASIILALLAIVLTLRLEETDETVNILIQQNEIMKEGINEQKQIYLNEFKKNISNIENIIFAIGLKLKIEPTFLFNLKSDTDVVKLASDIIASSKKLRLSTVLSFSTKTEAHFNSFEAAVEYFPKNTNVISNKDAVIRSYNKILELFHVLKKDLIEAEINYKKTFFKIQSIE